MARPYKNKPVTSTPKVEDEKFEEILDISDPNERSAELAKFDLTEGQKTVAQEAAREDFLEAPVVDEKVEAKPLSTKAQNLLDELDAKGVSVVYPSDFAKWDDATWQRLEKLNK